MAGAIPEKTFEHWASTYVLNRYHTKVPLWWPPDGADIEIGDLGNDPGKAFWLELKTAEWDPASHQHTVSINLWQLAKYASQRVPFYYVFPMPPWQGILASVPAPAWLGTERRSNLAFWRSHPKVFYHWTYVVSGWELYAAMSPSIQNRINRGTYGKRSSAQLLSYDPRQNVYHLNSRISQEPKILNWLDFWRDMDTCGGPGLPALFMVDRRHAYAPRMDREHLVGILRESSAPALEGLSYYAPDTNEEPTDLYESVPISTSEEGSGFLRSSRALVTIPSTQLKLVQLDE